VIRFIATLIAVIATTAYAVASQTTDATKSQTVVVANTKGNLRAIGAGVIIEKGSGLTIATVAHTTTFGGTLTVITGDGQTLNVTAVRIIEGHDLAILTTSVPFGAFRAATAGTLGPIDTPLHVWGHARAALFTLSPATVQDPAPQIPDGPTNGRFAIRCDTCGVGDSGSGVFDDAGRLVGIVTEGYSDDAGHVTMTVAEPIAPILAAIAPQSAVATTPR